MICCRNRIAACVLLLPAMCVLPQSTAATQAPDRPNVLFILADQLRYDALGANGNRDVYTPELDRLAREGIRFENSYCAQAVCTPSRASMLTGRYPHSHGLQNNIYDIPSAFELREYQLRPNFPELLHKAGYRTAYIGKWHLGDQNPGFFDYWKGFNSRLSHWLGTPYESAYRPDADTDDALKFIEENRSRSFLLCVSYYPPHDPYTARKRFHLYYEGKRLEPMEYYAAVSDIDWNVGRLLKKLRDFQLDRETLVIFTTEHGETFGKRPGSRHKRVGYEDSARIPLLMSFTGRLPSNIVWRSGVSLVDLMPTILEIVGLPMPAGIEGQSLYGRLIRGEDEWRNPIVVQNITDPLFDGSAAVERTIRRKRWKLILRQIIKRPDERTHELYDLENDPGETINLFDAADPRSVVRELSTQLATWGKQFRDPVSVALATDCLSRISAGGPAMGLVLLC